MADVQIAVIDQQNTQIALAAPSETEVTVAVPGVQGPVGEGVPAGGTANQVLFKQSGTDYDTAWSSVTSAMIGDLEIVNADVSASAAIAGTKISPDFGAQNVITTGTATAAALIPSGSSVPTNGVYLPSANNVAISTAGTGRLFVDSSGRVGVGTSSFIAGHVFAVTGGYSSLNGLRISGSDINNTIYQASGIGITTADYLTFSTGGSLAERLRITSDGKLGVGTSAPSSALEVSATAPVLTLNSAAANASSIVLQQTGTTYGRFRFDGTNVDIGNLYVNGATIFNAGGGEKARIDSSGRLMVGTSTGLSTAFAGSGQLQVVKDGINAAQIFGFSSTGQDYTPCLEIGRARGTQASPSAALSADWLGSINFYGHDGTQFIPAAYITARADGPTGTNDMPGRLVFSTTADGAAAPTERMRITSDGKLGVGTSSPISLCHISGPEGAYGQLRIQATGVGEDATVVLTTASNGRGIYLDESDSNKLKIYPGAGKGAAGEVVIDNTGKVGVGSSSDPGGIGSRLWIDDTTNSYFTVNTTGSGSLSGIHFRNSNGNGEARFVNNTGGALTFYRNSSTEAARLDSSGRLLVGTSAAFSTSSNALIQAVNTSGGEIVIGRDFALGTDSTVGSLAFFANPGTVAEAARIEAVADALHVGGAPTRLVFSTTASAASAATERARITSDGYLRLAGGGIQFNGDTAAANALDDYEEGTWTPSLGGNTTYVIQEGHYTKIGNVVTARFRLAINAIGTGSTSQITGLPFSSAGVGTGHIGYFTNIASSLSFISIYIDPLATTTASLYNATSAATGLILNPIFQNNANVSGTVVYHAT